MPSESTVFFAQPRLTRRIDGRRPVELQVLLSSPDCIDCLPSGSKWPLRGPIHDHLDACRVPDPHPHLLIGVERSCEPRLGRLGDNRASVHPDFQPRLLDDVRLDDEPALDRSRARRSDRQHWYPRRRRGGTGRSSEGRRRADATCNGRSARTARRSLVSKYTGPRGRRRAVRTGRGRRVSPPAVLIRRADQTSAGIGRISTRSSSASRGPKSSSMPSGLSPRYWL